MVRHRKKQTRLTQPKGKRRRQARNKSPTPSTDGPGEPEFIPQEEFQTDYVADPSCLAEIPAIYDVLAKKYWERVNSEGYKYCRPEVSRPAYDFQPDPSDLLIAAEKSKCAVRYQDKEGQIRQLKGFKLEDAPTFPPMRYFTHTNVNIHGKSKYSLSHLPYFGDDADDDKILEELKQIYVEGIHGTKAGCGLMLNDLLLYQLTDEILKLFELEGSFDELVPVMSSIYELFPNKASAREMVAMYPGLVARFGPAKVAKRAPMYNAVGEFTREFSAQEVMGNMASLMCKHCGTINCIFHSAEVTENDVHVERKNEDMGPSAEPCGDDCYRHFDVDAPLEPSGSKRKADSGSSSQMMANEAPGRSAVKWTAHEKTVINMILVAKLTCHCRFWKVYAATIRTEPKTCKQLYDYLKSIGSSIDCDIVDPNQKRKTKRVFEPTTNAHHRMFKAINKGIVDNNRTLRSCNHEGDCTKENECRCRLEGHVCNKFCGCPTTCQVRFPGCRCKPGKCGTNACQCFFASWECDPDICRSCNCEGSEESANPLCRNVNIQRGFQRKLYVAPSTVAGNGCFAEEPIKKGQFIGEYTGEIITDDEADRRGKIYDKYKCSYLFTLNAEFTIDSTRMGNVIRFINHSKNPNCQAKVMVSGADHHIGVFALENIAAKQELFLDYAYSEAHQKFVDKEQEQDEEMNFKFEIKQEAD